MARVSSILIYPDRDQPGQTLETSYVSPEGLDGDRRKRRRSISSPSGTTSTSTRGPTSSSTSSPRELHGLVGRRLRIGSVELEVSDLAGDCAGVYAEVPVPGDVSVGDEVLVGIPSE